MKYLFLLLFFVSSYRSACQLVKVDNNLILNEDLNDGVILGIVPVTVAIDTVWFDKRHDNYILKGHIPRFSMSDDTISRLSINLLNGRTAISDYSHTQKFGLFQVIMKKSDTLVFFDSTEQYARLFFKPTIKGNRGKK